MLPFSPPSTYLPPFTLHSNLVPSTMTVSSELLNAFTAYACWGPLIFYFISVWTVFKTLASLFTLLRKGLLLPLLHCVQASRLVIFWPNLLSLPPIQLYECWECGWTPLHLVFMWLLGTELRLSGLCSCNIVATKSCLWPLFNYFRSSLTSKTPPTWRLIVGYLYLHIPELLTILLKEESLLYLGCKGL